jgi:predicted transcriptional regulator
LMDDQLKVLKVMSEVTSRVDMNSFAQMVGLDIEETIQRMQDLASAGFIRRTNGGYSITEKGKALLKAIAPIPKELAFHFYTAIGQPTGFSAESLKDFYEIVKRAAVESLEFHLYREDFENWIKTVFEDATLATAFADLRVSQLKGEELRQAILKAIVAKFNL